MSGSALRDIRSLSKTDLEQFFTSQGLQKYKGAQVYDWLWKKGCQTFEGMTSIAKSDRQLLAGQFSFDIASVAHIQKSSDGTLKVVFRTTAGHIVEGVLIPSGGRYTACISSQAGCAMGCRFCATGALGFSANLSAGEIFDQVVHLARLAVASDATHAGAVQTGKQDNPVTTGHPLSNIVLMGMGEPLLNYETVKKAIGMITAPEGLNFSPQRITLSSVGIPRMIRKMADEDPRYHFALSLHAATDEKRNLIIPANKKFPLADLVTALRYYHQKTGKRITIEYVLFENFNDSITDAQALAGFCRNFPVKINLIGYNEVEGSGFHRSTPVRTKAFREYLERLNLVVNLRRSRGEDIRAACGQLAGKILQNQDIDNQ